MDTCRAGRIVIGEGERDEDPMLTSRGSRSRRTRHGRPENIRKLTCPLTRSKHDLARLVRTTHRGARRFGARRNPHAPDIYMDKIVVGPSSRGVVDIDAPVKDNRKNIARRLGRDVEDLTVIVLDRPRHRKLIQDMRDTGARIRLISDGDLSAGISAAVAGTNIHAVMGIGGAPEGVITAAALKCLNGEIQALCFDLKSWRGNSKVPPPDSAGAWREGITDPEKVTTRRLAPVKNHLAETRANAARPQGRRFFGRAAHAL